MAQTATITGVVFDEQNNPLSDVNISSTSEGTFSDSNGYYALQITADTETKITFSHVGHKEVILENLILTTNETYEFNPVMKTDVIQVDGVTVTPTGEKSVEGITTIPREVVRQNNGIFQT